MATVTFQVQVVSGVLPPTGGGAGLVPLAIAALLAGLALIVVTRRRKLSLP
jgi:LPXTG-motif cell wall-anchored protein